MKILILGGSGMVGHNLVKTLSDKHEVFASLRKNQKFELTSFFKNIIEESNCIYIENINDYFNLNNIIKNLSPEIIINCIGVIKQRDSVNNLCYMIKINALLPHILNDICIKYKIKLIHLSTDCVFSGNKGDYKETDIPDPVDKYGQSKLLGEINEEGNALTIRTSFIGVELFNKKSLFEWIKSQKNGEIEGYDKAIYSGLTTNAFSRIINEIIDNHLNLSGLWQISSKPISKYDLIKMINDKFNLNIKINRNSSFQCNRSLNSSKFSKKTKILIPSWEKMINELYEAEK